jgi:hypothetical protein
MLRAGDHVLMGGSYASFPADWYFASVLWADGTDVLLHRSDLNGNYYRQIDSVLSVRAVGTIAELSAIKEQARKAVHDLNIVVSEAGSELGRARAALHAELDQLAAGGLKIIPRNHEAIAESEAETRRAVEAIDEEETSGAVCDASWGGR